MLRFLKLNSSSVFTFGKCASLMRRATAFCSRSSTSADNSASRKDSGLCFYLADCSASRTACDATVGRRRALATDRLRGGMEWETWRELLERTLEAATLGKLWSFFPWCHCARRRA